MGKMKDLYIDEMNRQLAEDVNWDDTPEYNPASFTQDDNQMTPPPNQLNLESGKSMWVINGYKIWADSYQQALELLPMIESF